MPRVSSGKRQPSHGPLAMTAAQTSTNTNNLVLETIRNNRRPVTKPSPSEVQELRDIFSQRWYNVGDLKELEHTTGKCFKRGKFSAKERDIIRRSLEEFCRDKGLTQQEFVDAFFNKKQRGGERYRDKRFKQVFIDVAKKLDGRPVILVYQCMRRMFHPGNFRGRWSEADDSELKKLFLLHGPDWETIGLSMGRYGMSVRDRYKYFRNKGSTGPWTEDEVERLKSAVLEVRKITDAPCWLLVSERVGTRSIPQCMMKWTLLETIDKNRGQRPYWTRTLDYYLASRIYDLAVEHESEIGWKDLIDDGWPVYFRSRDLQIRFKILRKRVHNNRNILFDDLLETLLLTLRPLSPDTIHDEDMIE